MELKKGMYVIDNERLNIGKIKDFCYCELCRDRGFYEPIIDNPDLYLTDFDKANGFHGYKFYDNIIDLVQVGDYVNGHKILGVYNFKVEVESDAIENETWKVIESNDIKSIVTKEQMANISYEVIK